MAVTKKIIIDVETKQAQKSFEDLSSTIQEQKDITIEFEKELRSLETQLSRTSKAELSKQKLLKDRITGLKTALKDQRVSLKELNNEKLKATQKNKSYSDGIKKTSGLMQGLDQATGGLASGLLDVARASKKSGKAMRVALASSGIGLIVVAVGLLVEHWDDIKEAVGNSNKEIQKQIDLSIRNQKSTQLNLDLLSKQIDLNEKLGKGNEVLQAQRLEILKVLLKQNGEEITGLQLQNERLKSAAFELTTREKILKTVLNTFRAGSGDAFILEKQIEASLKYKDNLDLITKSKTDQVDLEIKLFDLQNPKIKNTKKDTEKVDKDKIERDRLKALSDFEKELNKADEDLFDTTEAEKIERQRERAQEELDNLVATETEKREAQLLLTEFYDELEFQNQLELDANKRAQREKTAAEEIADAKAVNDAKEGIRNANLSNISRGFSLIASLDEKNKTLQATSLIAEHGVAIAKSIISTKAANALVTLKYAAIPGGIALATAEKTANNISAGLGIAASGIALAKGLAALKKGGGGGGGDSVGGDSGGSAPSAPAFNLVAGTGTNQIAESIGGQNRPIEAYVVSGNVTSGQSLDRNIVESSTI